MSTDDLVGRTVLFAQNLPEYWVDHHLPAARSAVEIVTLPGFREILAYVTSGSGVAVVGAQVEHLYPRPGLTCVPLAGEPSFDYALVWRTDQLGALAEAFLHQVAS
ncbi:hypothetical protein SAMN05421810_102190 [Amycolatopsis arida]|uniref:LysR substrate binding domain-containing protein n=1 Tax=Amycolatopsis arida TaxID=587909 RepID=A0A1I5P8W3_9PSEU|nr:hypothetical protein [Amycolatopsis arida]TDX98398.1 hypothetical protein CLV69_101190 [Amycolatopsis arida]SFP30220.1 hypothetical protein SAMN05421810_102190 [Amycolatopsis arida]